LQLELNEFADMSWEVFAKTRLGFDATKQAARYVCYIGVAVHGSCGCKPKMVSKLV
jgi:hypothetical protein